MDRKNPYTGPAIDRRSALLGGAALVVPGAAVGACSDQAPIQPATSLSVKVLGAAGDGRADDSAAVQAAYDRLAGLGGGVLLFPRGTYRVALNMTTRLVHLRGEGRGVTILRAASPAGTALRALYALASWDSVSIADLSIQGAGRRQGVGLVCGHQDYVANDEYIGRTNLDRVGFDNLDRCISRPYGNIGLNIDSCTFGDANYHFWTRSNVSPPGDPMHGGNLIVTRSRFTAFQRAMFYLDSGSTSGGQIVFSECVVENGPGFAIYIRAFNAAGPTPTLRFRNTWNENNATGRDIEVEGVRHAEPRFLYARDCTGPILFDDTPPSSLELAAARVETRDCNLDALAVARADAGSQLIHHNARQYSGLAPGLCRSISGPTGASGLRTPWFRMPLPRGMSRAYQDAVLQRSDGASPIAFTGSDAVATRTIAGDAALVGRTASQELTIAAGQQLWPAPLFDVAAGRWLVVAYLYRLVSGDPVKLQVNGSSGLSGQVDLASGSWEMLLNISENPGGSFTGEGLMHILPRGRSVLRIGGFAAAAFGTRQQAVEFANSGLFPG